MMNVWQIRGSGIGQRLTVLSAALTEGLDVHGTAGVDVS
jgi:hypothetical protein